MVLVGFLMQTIENQEELRAALDKVKDLQKSLEELQTKQQESEHKSQQQQDLQVDHTHSLLAFQS